MAQRFPPPCVGSSRSRGVAALLRLRARDGIRTRMELPPEGFAVPCRAGSRSSSSAFEALEKTAANVQRPKLHAIEIAALRSQAESLRAEIADYELLRSGTVETITANSVLGVADLLIKARIARGWTQAQTRCDARYGSASHVKAYFSHR